MNDVAKFSEDDLIVWPYYGSYLIEILNGDYTVEEAASDLRSLIGSEYDPRAAPDLRRASEFTEKNK